MGTASKVLVPGDAALPCHLACVTSDVDAKPGSGVYPGISADFEDIDGGDVVSNHPVTSSATVKGETIETSWQKRDTDLSREHAPFDGCSERGAMAVAAVEACAEGVNQVEESGILAGATVLAAAEVADETASITVVVEEGEEGKGVEKTVEETTPASRSNEESKPSWVSEARTVAVQTRASVAERRAAAAGVTVATAEAREAAAEVNTTAEREVAAGATEMTEQNAAIADKDREIEGNQQILRMRSRMAWRSCHEELLVATKSRQAVSSRSPAKEGGVAGQGVCGGERRKEEKEEDDKREEEKEKKDEEEQEEERERGAAARDDTVVREESPINAPGVYASTNVAAATARAAGRTPAPSATAAPTPAPAPLTAAAAAALAADTAAGCGASPSMGSRKVHFKVEVDVGWRVRMLAVMLALKLVRVKKPMRKLARVKTIVFARVKMLVSVPALVVVVVVVAAAETAAEAETANLDTERSSLLFLDSGLQGVFTGKRRRRWLGLQRKEAQEQNVDCSIDHTNYASLAGGVSDASEEQRRETHDARAG
eukprot:jgi/Undpi1/10544/HiC_scaffold_29.g12994.m1